MKRFKIPNRAGRQFAWSALALLLGAWALPASAADDINWQDWSPGIFKQAKAQHKFVLLDLEAVWCHWCHVMDAKTYTDPKVIELLKSKYIAVKVDQDSHPALSNRYGDWGWPATIVFAPDGSEIVKRQGYLPPPVMSSMLQAIIDDPSPGPSIQAQPEVKSASSVGLNPKQRDKLRQQLNAIYDPKYGGWGNLHKYLSVDALDYEMVLARRGDEKAARRVKQTLDAGSNLIDPIWGGVYQYSDAANWKSPHFEKIMSFQADNLRLYSEAYAQWGTQQYRSNAKAVYGYLTKFLSAPNGGFYTSQNADLNKQVDGHAFYALDGPARRKLGMPRIDKHIYARENGWAIRALARYADITGEQAPLERAIKAANFIIKSRGLNGGGFAHGANPQDRPYLGDSLAMSQALIALYRSTGDRAWLKRATAALDFINKRFKDDKLGGYITAIPDPNATGVLAKPVRLLGENSQLVRAANLAYFYTGKQRYRDMAEHAVGYASAPAIVDSQPYLPGVLLANFWINNEPAHVTVVGHKDDKAAQALDTAARRYPADYMLLEWWDKREGALPNPAINYPDLGKPAAFACANQSCSLPVFEPGKVAGAVDRLRSHEAQTAEK